MKVHDQFSSGVHSYIISWKISCPPLPYFLFGTPLCLMLDFCSWPFQSFTLVFNISISLSFCTTLGSFLWLYPSNFLLNKNHIVDVQEFFNILCSFWLCVYLISCTICFSWFDFLFISFVLSVPHWTLSSNILLMPGCPFIFKKKVLKNWFKKTVCMGSPYKEQVISSTDWPGG